MELGRPRRQDGKCVRELWYAKAHGEKLYIASLAVVTKKDKIRLFHDATLVPGEMRTLPREWQERRGGAKMFVVIGDASKAHRRIKVKKRIGDTRLADTVGTYGLALAGYYWARLASGVVVRLFHYLLGSGDQEILLFADDAVMFVWMEEIGAMIFLWVAQGVPWKWSKFRGGQQVKWIGYWLSVADFRLGISEKRARWIPEWVPKCLEKMKDFHAALGRLCFAMGALDCLRLFTAPLFAWAAAVGARGMARLLWSVSFLLRHIADNVDEEGRAGVVKPRGENLGPAWMADAKAEGQHVCIGGWQCLGGLFSMVLTRDSAP